MKKTTTVAIQTLESRTLYSATTHAGDSPAVTADRKQVAADEQQLKTDRAARKQDMADDRAAIKAARQGADDQTKPLTDTLKQHHSDWKTTLSADQDAILTTRKADLSVYFADMAKVEADTDPTQAAADQKTADDAGAKLKSDVAALKAKRDSDRAAMKSQKADDEKAVDDLKAQLQPGIDAAVAKWKADKAADEQKIADDKSKLATDRGQLEIDLAAESGGGTTTVSGGSSDA